MIQRLFTLHVLYRVRSWSAANERSTNRTKCAKLWSASQDRKLYQCLSLKSTAATKLLPQRLTSVQVVRLECLGDSVDPALHAPDHADLVRHMVRLYLLDRVVHVAHACHVGKTLVVHVFPAAVQMLLVLQLLLAILVRLPVHRLNHTTLLSKVILR